MILTLLVALAVMVGCGYVLVQAMQSLTVGAR